MSTDYLICDECGNKMEKTTTSHEFTFRGKTLELKGIEAYKCSGCDNVIFDDQDYKMIEDLLVATKPLPEIDILNLEETAETLRVSNQTIYNKIKSGELRAYKIGREWRFMKADIMNYINASSNINHSIPMAAKSGVIDETDAKKIIEEIEKRKHE